MKESIMKILLVDDATFMRMMLRNVLEKAGHTIVGEASNGREGLEKYKELKPELVFLDITMPEVDGLACIKSIRAFDNKANVIMCSAMGQQAMVIEAIQSGAKDFIVKPFQPDRIYEAIKKVTS